MQGKITRISVTWAEHTSEGTDFRFYNVLPDEQKIIRPERMEELLDDLTVICEQLQAARDGHAIGTNVTGGGVALRRIK
jgi:hypothetical protein